MDNNPKNPAENLGYMMKFAMGFLKQVENAEGFKLTDEQKADFKKKMVEQGIPEKIEAAKIDMQKIVDRAKAMKYATVNKTQ